MPDRMRRRLSDAMLRAGMERALERQEVERGLAGVNPQAPGYQSAMAALSAARVAESVLLWCGWRLQPRTVEHLSP